MTIRFSALDRGVPRFLDGTFSNGDRITLQVEDVDVNRVVGELLDLGIDLTHMNVQIPNLETVFLNLTGRRLRD